MEQVLTIQQLCDLTGLPRRTIHFYSQQGILPPPSGAGPGAVYSAEHLLRLRLIPLLRQQGLRLDEIRRRYQETSLEDLRQVYDGFNPVLSAPAPPAERAQSYLHYPLPGGCVLVTPARMSMQDRKKVSLLLQSAQKLWAETDAQDEIGPSRPLDGGKNGNS